MLYLLSPAQCERDTAPHPRFVCCWPGGAACWGPPHRAPHTPIPKRGLGLQSCHRGCATAAAVPAPGHGSGDGSHHPTLRTLHFACCTLALHTHGQTRTHVHTRKLTCTYMHTHVHTCTATLSPLLPPQPLPSSSIAAALPAHGPGEAAIAALPQRLIKMMVRAGTP